MSAIVPRNGKSEKNRPAPPSSFSARVSASDKPRKVRNVTSAADYAELERCYTFVPSNEKQDTTTSSWQDRMVKHYHSHLYKEYVLADLRRPGQVGLRWRTQQEVEIGKGHSTCGNKHCPSYVIESAGRDENSLAAYYHQSVAPPTETEEQRLLDRVPYGLGLYDYEVNFAYVEGGVRKNELVKLRLCLRCAPQLFHTKGGALGARHARRAMNEDTLDNVDPEEKHAGDVKDSDTSSSEDESDARRKQRRHNRKKNKRRKRRKKDYSGSESEDSEKLFSGEDANNLRSKQKRRRGGGNRESEQN